MNQTNPDDFAFLSLAFRQRYIRRWSLMRSQTEEDLAQHSSQVALIAHALALIGNRLFGKHYSPERAATLALFHDIPEVFTGDLPTPVKYSSPQMRADYRQIEEKAVVQMLDRIPDSLREDYRPLLEEVDEPERVLVKTADRLCAYIKCLDEIEGGNREFVSAKASIEASLQQYASPELDYFTSHCLPFFTKTLDEI